MKKLLSLSLILCFGVLCADEEVDCENYCRNAQGEKCYDTYHGDFDSPGATDGESDCGDLIEECLDNCQKEAAKKKQSPPPQTE